jgi:hypothetical protein
MEPAAEPAAAETEPEATVPAPPPVPPVGQGSESARSAIRYAGSSAQDYWEGTEGGQFVGLVYPERKEPERKEDVSQHDQADIAASGNGQPGLENGQGASGWDTPATAAANGRPASGWGTPPELDDDAPPFATAPFAAVPRLNRVRSTPAPPAEDEEEDN